MRRSQQESGGRKGRSPQQMRKLSIIAVLSLLVVALAAATAFAVDSKNFNMVRSQTAVANDCLEGARANADAETNPAFAPVHTYHVGLWFGSPEEAAAAGCPDTVTPFDGDHSAGIQAFSTRNFGALQGPLRQIQ